MRLLVTGGRKFADEEFVDYHLGNLHNSRGITHLIHGAATGADSICADWAEENEIEVVPYPANWTPNGILDRGAGHKRNQRMLDEGKPDACFAFPGGTGTADMVSRIPEWMELWQSTNIFFKKEDPTYWFCSNFATGFGFYDDGGTYWDTSEHYYQAMKAPRPEDQEYVRQAPTPAESKKRAREVLVVSHLDHIKNDIMRDAISYKFAKGTKAAELLQETGIDYLIEYAPWGDTYWGVGRNKKGLNWLGRILMEQRNKL